MATAIKLPELGENIDGGEVLTVRVAAGGTVAEGQSLLEVEAEKATIEVPAPLAGRVTELLVKKGDRIQVGQTICTIEEVGVGSSRELSAESQEPNKPKDVLLWTPKSQESGVAARSSRELSAESQEPNKPKDVQLWTPKSQESGVAARFQRAGESSERSAPAAPASPRADRVVPAGPATRRLARELGVDLTHVKGTAPGGRVTAEDVKAYVRQVTAGVAVRGPAGIQPPPLPDFERWGPVERRPLESIRRRTAEQMSLAWHLVPHVTQHDQADITDLDAFRRQQEGPGQGPKLTVTAFALRAAANALKQFPEFNASLDMTGGQLIVKRYYHIGVAVDTERGLLVPVLRDVERKSVRELAGELAELADRARRRKVAVEEMRGGTFTITNLGGIGGTGFSPIVNYPEVAILGLSRSRLQPVFRDGQVVPRLILPLSLSYDHRVIDGAAAARFTRRLAEMFENPLLMLL